MDFGILTVPICAYVICAFRDLRSRRPHEAIFTTAALIGSAIFSSVALLVQGNSLLGALRSSSILCLLILAITAGHPILLFDLTKEEKKQHIEEGGSDATLKRRVRAVRLRQISFIIVIIVGMSVYYNRGLDFLD